MNFSYLSKRTYTLYIFIGLVAFCALIQNIKCEKAEDEMVEKTKDSFDSDVEKRAIDKMRFYGGLGKRSDESQISENDDDDEIEESYEIVKRLDKMRYYGGLGKRGNDNSNQKYPSAKRLDKMKYFGGLGKRSEFSDFKKNRLNYLLAKKSKNIDRFRYMGSIGK
ncbi:unnamed protein product [Brachionus calyciflorus]|uniref:Uncharacterized protein n=1 Tax=Brachionus calyciflorus TaxID=104777 RepID=A0A813VKQ1_9BILA|nr:unnamed protein product [Brachionus calyciflorus]